MVLSQEPETNTFSTGEKCTRLTGPSCPDSTSRIRPGERWPNPNGPHPPKKNMLQHIPRYKNAFSNLRIFCPFQVTSHFLNEKVAHFSETKANFFYTKRHFQEKGVISMSDAAQPFSLAEYQGANLIRPSEMKTLAHEKCFHNRSHNARVFTFAGKRALRGIFCEESDAVHCRKRWILQIK